jgi:GNAT superfamily N-acetyltransferase
VRSIRLRPSDITRLGDLQRTPPDATGGVGPWVNEVEAFVFGAELPRLARIHGEQLELIAIEAEGNIIAVGVMYPDPVFAAIRIGALVIDHRHRGRRIGGALLRELVNRAVVVAPALWLVHPENQAMLTCSRQLMPPADEARLADGYFMFVAGGIDP